MVSPAAMKYTCSKRCTCDFGPPDPGDVLSMATVMGLPLARLVKVWRFSPDFRSAGAGTVISRMYCAALSTFFGC